MKREKLSFRLETNLKDRLDQQAAQQDISTAEVVREAVKDYLQDKSRTK